jgi:hypothetical protein
MQNQSGWRRKVNGAAADGGRYYTGGDRFSGGKAEAGEVGVGGRMRRSYDHPRRQKAVINRPQQL